jgi:GNAT superfamily N-acetyltransferase
MSEAQGPRTVRPDEFPDLMRLVNGVFTSPGGMERALPLLFGEANRHHLWLVEADGKPVSHLGITVKEAAFGPVRTRVAAVGAVATYPECRGRGYATRLLQAAWDQADAEGADLCMISGGRGLYRRAGCCPLPGPLSASVEPERLPQVRVRLRPYQGDLTPFATLWEAEPVRWVRDDADWRLLLTQSPLGRYRWVRVWVERQGRPAAYVMIKIHNHPHPHAALTEHAGDRRLALAAARRVCHDEGLARLRVGIADHDTEAARLLFGAELPPAHEPHGTGQVLNLPRLLSRCPGLPAGLRVQGNRDRWVLNLGGESLVLAGEAPSRLVWGQQPGEPELLPATGPWREVLGALFPLPRLCYGMNYV